MFQVQATGVSPGFALAPAFLVGPSEPSDPARRGAGAPAEASRLEAARRQTLADLEALRDQTLRALGQAKAEIFEAHLSMARDPELWALADQHLADGWDAETAVYRACQTFLDLLAGLEEEGQRSRADDLKDVRRRFIDHLTGRASGPRLSGPCILVAEDLTPSQTMGLDLSCVKGFVTAAGSRTSHASILARSLGLPSATGAGEVVSRVVAGQLLALDGQLGTVIVDPDDAQQAAFSQAQARDQALRARRQKFAGLPTQTADGVRLQLGANIGRVEDLGPVIDNGAEGVGLFRTEVLFLDRDRTPTEDEQTAVYRHVLERLAGKPVVIRTLDIGGDKVIPYLPQAPELNPFLGVRAVRLCLEQESLFRTQIRALLRASSRGDLRVMVPMVALVEEVHRVRALFDQEAAGLATQGVPLGRFELGIMVEIPAAALNAPALAEVADFFSLGTNDLIQYTMAADRMNEKLTSLYQPLHPSVLRLIDLTVKGAHGRGRWVGVCGEMASDPEAAVVLVGLGVDELSLSAQGIPQIREVLSLVNRARAAETAQLALGLGTADEVLRLVRTRHPELNPAEGDAP